MTLFPPARTVYSSACWLHCRWTPMTWGSARTWATLCWWRSRRRSTGCTTTGTAGTSRSRPRLESIWSSPASAGWWMRRRWCCGTEEVQPSASSLRLESAAQKKCQQSPPPPWCSIPHSVLCLFVAHLPQDDKTSLVKQHRQKELDMRRKTYRQVHSAYVCCRRPRLLGNVQ